MKINRFLMLCLMTLTLSSCDPVERTLGKMESLVEDAEQNGGNYTSDDWNCFIVEYDALRENLADYQGEFTQEDYRLLGQITARYQKVALAYTLDVLYNGMNSSEKFISGYLDGLGFEESEIPIDSLIDEYVDAVENALGEGKKLIEL